MEMLEDMPRDAEPGKVGALPVDSVEDAKEKLKQFTDSVHQKASQIVSWMTAVEPMQTERKDVPHLQHHVVFVCLFWIPQDFFGL